MEVKTRVTVLISGEGTNLQAILDAVRSGSLRVEIVLVSSNVATAPGLRRAERAGVPTVVIPHQDYPSREAFEEELVRKLRAADTDLVVLAGFMRVLSKKFVDLYQGRVMNIHPALLPAFPGVGAIENAWSSGAKVTGVTVHFVDEGVDTGPIILQEAVPIGEGESLESLARRIHETEHRLYPEAIRLYAEGRLALVGRKVTIRRSL